MYTKKIYINGKFLTQQESGVQAYAMGLINAMISNNVDFQILTPKSLVLSDRYNIKPIGFFSNGVLWEQISLPRYVNKQKNVVLINFCNSAPLLSKNQIVTIHDLAFEKSNVAWFSRRFKTWYRFLIPRICQSARHILTVSEFSKNEIISKYNITPDKISIVPNGVDIQQETKERQVKDDYLLLVGGNNPRKNIFSITSQIDQIAEKGLKLVVLGQHNSVFNEQKQIFHPSIIYLEYVSKEKYFNLLKYCKALIYPSLYEGFGIPILESLCLKVPVICNDLLVFRESFGDLPIYYNATNSDEFLKVLDNVSAFSISDEEVGKLKSKYSFNNSLSLILKVLEIV